MSKLSGDDLNKFQELSSKPYKEQAKWFLNAFWHDLFEGKDDECESIWLRTQEFVKLDMKMQEDGCQLDEALSHKFLENLGETLTVLELRERLRKIDLDQNGYMSLTEYLLFRYNKSVDLILRPQADPKEIKEAADKVAAAQADHNEMQAALAEAENKLAAAEQAKKELEVAQQKVADAKAEAERTLSALQAEEKAFNDKCKDLEEKSKSGSVVQKGRAASELAQLQSQDPLPLRMAKINQGAAVRKLEKAERAAADAVLEADKKVAASEEAKESAELAVAEAEKSFNEAVAFLEDVKSRAGSSEGAVWWMEREVEEIRKYRPGYKPKKK